ncbi:uncharacterized protein LAESUDRAFT_716287 [Laetiporus sulphureus 93-53]|uniref:Uncharacterized protein n=1 Tax=Laetiporus sulphureus 93-53 TaxID=1314785 RepID=A0A165CR44_9APHY|nr:uncharacterized protein LAESUDRAFT_716287 [Laetiporus sulphureus 93-53]KZT03275.1 hypothetical protein LAESUDRAFT_716287 [Laetiporus sulphureus 93-53]
MSFHPESAEHFRKPSIQNAIFGSARRRRPSNPKPVSVEDTLQAVKGSDDASQHEELEGLSLRPGPDLESNLSVTVGASRSNDAAVKESSAVRAARRERGASVQRPSSPDVGTILANTPRPRRRSYAAAPTAFRTPHRSSSGVGCHNDLKEAGSDTERELDGSESDSSIDLHTPLPHLMFRDGLLSPRSKLLPKGPGMTSSFPYLLEEDEEGDAPDRSLSVLSAASMAGSITTKAGVLYKDPRDTVRRRIRHRDGSLLRAGMGLTTGLGWSDSEDEDAPSTLTRKLIHTSITRKTSLSASNSRPLSEATRESTVVSPPPAAGSHPSKDLPKSASTSNSSLSSLRPSTADSTSSLESTPTRVRAQSSMSIFSTGASSMPTTPSSRGVAGARRVQRPLKSTDIQAIISRQRALSSASTSSVLSTGSVSGLPGRASYYQRSLTSFTANGARPRTMSAASSVSSVSTYSSMGASGSSTPSGGSTSTTSGMPRPLRLSQSMALRQNMVRSPSGIPSKTGVLTNGQHARTLSSVPSVRNLSQLPSAAPIQRADSNGSSTSTTSTPTTPTNTRATPTPPSSPRVRPLVAGPRPKPRTGTGMVYRTSSYASLQAGAIRVHSVSVSPGPDGGVMF